MRRTKRVGPRTGWLILAVVLSPLAAAAQEPLPATQWTEDEILARFNHEPSVRDIQDVAIRYYQVHPDRISSLRTSARLKALMPSINGSFSNKVYSENLRMDDYLYVPAGFPFKEKEALTGDSMGFSIGAIWNLQPLVFNAEVLDVQSLIGILDGLVREVTTIYYIRRRLQIDMILRPPKDLASRISNRLRVEELTGLLDAMTGGYMTRIIERNLAKKTRATAPANK